MAIFIRPLGAGCPARSKIQPLLSAKDCISPRPALRA
jgi:hypothetical protein